MAWGQINVSLLRNTSGPVRKRRQGWRQQGLRAGWKEAAGGRRLEASILLGAIVNHNLTQGMPKKNTRKIYSGGGKGLAKTLKEPAYGTPRLLNPSSCVET